MGNYGLRDKSQPADKTEVWLKNKHGVVSCVPAYIAAKLLQDKNKGFEITDPEFVPSKQIRPHDEEKTVRGKQRANTEKSYYEIGEIIGMTASAMKDYCKENEISLTGRTTKKQILEAIEKSGKLY